MPFVDLGRLRVFQFETIPTNGVTHAIFTRRGGLSPAPWASLNLGGGVGDDRDRVEENRRLALRALGRPPESVYDVWQVHSAEVVVAEAARTGSPPVRADAILTDRPEVTLLMRFADCVPILVCDVQRGVLGIAHAGWLGTVRQVARAMVRSMVARFGCRPASLWAGLGPSIAAHHYPVGPEVVDAVHSAFGADGARHLIRVDGGHQFDLWSANRQMLHDEGVGHIETAGLCSACHTDDWYSHRAEAGRTGRFGAVLAWSS